MVRVVRGIMVSLGRFDNNRTMRGLSASVYADFDETGKSDR